MIEVKDLVKKYGDHIAVDHLSFTVPRGQILGFLGPNGAGKSTTMNIITGYISATDGTVVVNGHDIYEEPEEAKKSIGYLPEQPPVYPDMTVYEYLCFVADLKKVAKSEKKQMITDIMEATKITNMKNRLIKHLSKGYKQRVGLAQAIMGYPEVIILDEPTVGLDPMQIIEIRDLIKDLSKKHTIILSSHIMQEVSAVCDQVMIINKGKLIVSENPEQLIEHFGSTGMIELVVKGNEEEVEKILSEMDGIGHIKFVEVEEEIEAVKCRVEVKHDLDLREAIFFAFAEAKVPILEQRSIKRNLENIFLMVTQEEQTSDATSDTATENLKEAVNETSDYVCKEENQDAGNL